ncbi:MAG: type I-B CRISPR-associated protein Cas7/Csh2 [bacterium]
MSKTIKNRSEVLFLYDVTDANPNGDPNDENKPRIDEETGFNIVTDVRLKRTIRDYLLNYKEQKIFIKEERKEGGRVKSKDDHLKDYKNKNPLFECIDLRLFGATTAVKEGRATYTGPVQFKYGRSLHKVDLTFIKGTTVMPSAESKMQGTFTERYILPYSLIAFYGVINENAAAVQEIPLTEEDIDFMMEAIWHGTKNLISGSKFGQMPRLLLQVIYTEGTNFYLGELDKKVKLISGKQDKEIRRITDCKIDITQLIFDFTAHQEKLTKIRYKTDDQVVYLFDGQEIKFDAALGQIGIKQVEQFKF